MKTSNIFNDWVLSDFLQNLLRAALFHCLVTFHFTQNSYFVDRSHILHKKTPKELLCKSLGSGVLLGHWNHFYLYTRPWVNLILQPYSRLGIKIPNPIPDWLFFCTLSGTIYCSPTYSILNSLPRFNNYLCYKLQVNKPILD